MTELDLSVHYRQHTVLLGQIASTRATAALQVGLHSGGRRLSIAGGLGLRGGSLLVSGDPRGDAQGANEPFFILGPTAWLAGRGRLHAAWQLQVTAEIGTTWQGAQATADDDVVVDLSG